MNKLFLVLAVALLARNAAAQTAPNPFFLTGDGHVKIQSPGGRLADVVYRRPDGTLDDAAFRKIDAVFGFPTDAMGENVSRRTISFLDHFIDRFNKDAVAKLASGYRSQNYNNKLRARGATAAKTSTHIDGMALDFSLAGVNGKTLWETIKNENCCGAGYYYGNIVHLDSGRPRFWTTETSKVRTNESDYNRQSYVSTEYDRYRRGDKTRLLFTSLSDFGFGVKGAVAFVRDPESADVVKKAALLPESPAKPAPGGEADCRIVATRQDARFLYLRIPDNLKPGRYRVRVDFCAKPFAEMPDFRVSNEIEIVGE